MERKVIRDGHIHTPFCPHGTSDTLEMYIDQARAIGLEVMSFTEHMPLPEGVLPEEIAELCSPSTDVMLDYFRAVEQVKKKYENQITIATGMEVDYIEGYEAETKRLLNLYGPYIQDSLLSAHILKIGETHTCFDWEIGFEEAMEKLGSVEAIYDLYYKTLLKAIRADLGPYKPRRLAHISLVRVLQKSYPIEYTNNQLLEEVVIAMKEGGYSVEFNTGGLRKPACQELYPDQTLRRLIEKYEIPVVWGSDAHRAQDVGFGFGEY